MNVITNAILLKNRLTGIAVASAITGGFLSTTKLYNVRKIRGSGVYIDFHDFDGSYGYFLMNEGAAVFCGDSHEGWLPYAKRPLAEKTARKRMNADEALSELAVEFPKLSKTTTGWSFALSSERPFIEWSSLIPGLAVARSIANFPWADRLFLPANQVLEPFRWAFGLSKRTDAPLAKLLDSEPLSLSQLLKLAKGAPDGLRSLADIQSACESCHYNFAQ